MIEYLYASGCSWTHGNGLHEDPIFVNSTSDPHSLLNEFSKYAWPFRLGEMLNCQIQNDAFGAGSNPRMIRRTIEFLERYPVKHRDKLLIVLGWSTLERNEIYVEEYGRWMNYNAAQPFSDQFMSSTLTDEEIALNKNIDRAQKQYVTWVHSNQADIDAYFQQLFLLKNTLENMKIKYIFFNALPWSWDTPSHANKTKFDSFASPNIIGPGNLESMITFCNENGYPLSSCHHPMVDGHQKWAERLYKQVKIIQGDND